MKYAALLRGIGPTNPNMRGEKLREVFESLGFANVQSVITSGNVLFESGITDVAKLETMAEKALPDLLGFSRDVFIRSQTDLRTLVEADPFKGLVHENAGKTYLTVTFFKTPPADMPPLPHRPAGKSYELLTMANGALCCAVDLSTGKTPDLMAWMERNFGKAITTRTWKTVNRLLAKLDQM